MKKLLAVVLCASVGLLCLILLRSRHGAHSPPAEPGTALRDGSTQSGTTAAAKPPGPADPSSDAVRKLATELGQMLSRSDRRPNETVLNFKTDAALAAFLARAREAGLTVVGRIDALRSVRVRYSNLADLQKELSQHASGYEDVSGNTLVGIPGAPPRQDRAAGAQVPFGNRALGFIGATGDRSNWGRGVTIAVLDTGIASDRTFGTGRVTALDIGQGIAPGSGADDGHGTSVASLAAGASPDAPGVAPAANLLSIKVTDAQGTSDIFTIAQGIVAAADSGAKVINVSLGGYATNSTLDGAIAYAQQQGAVVVAAAGNDQAAQLDWPAADPRVISVGAVDGAGQQVTFSNSGPQLQLSAPGLGVQTAWLNGQRAYVDGTSASAPLVAGAIAAIVSQNPTLTAADAASRLTATATDAGEPGYDPNYGHGILDVGWAMNYGNPNYVDTAVSSHYFDTANNVMDFVLQNRSGQAVAGLSLDVAAGTTTTTYMIPELLPAQTYVFKLPVNTAQLKQLGSIQYTTTLVNPVGLSDQVPENNRRTSVLTAPGR